MGRRLQIIARMAAALACALAAGWAHAQVYKCPDATGKVTYQQTPCEAAAPKAAAKAEVAAPTLASKDPESRTVDQCIKLHEFGPHSPKDFQSRGGVYAPGPDGGWLLVIAGTALKDGTRAPETMRCPVTASGAINLDLWRAQAPLVTIERDRRGEAAAGPGAARDGRRIANADKAGERKTIDAKIRGNHLTEEQVRRALGDPDAYGSVLGSCPLPASRATYACRLTTWIYMPAALDQQMRTTITFSQDGEAIEVVRAIQY